MNSAHRLLLALTCAVKKLHYAFSPCGADFGFGVLENLGGSEAALLVFGALWITSFWSSHARNHPDSSDCFSHWRWWQIQLVPAARAPVDLLWSIQLFHYHQLTTPLLQKQALTCSFGLIEDHRPGRTDQSSHNFACQSACRLDRLTNVGRSGFVPCQVPLLGYRQLHATYVSQSELLHVQCARDTPQFAGVSISSRNERAQR